MFGEDPLTQAWGLEVGASTGYGWRLLLVELAPAEPPRYTFDHQLNNDPQPGLEGQGSIAVTTQRSNNA